jgi:hypothetical protein
MNRPGQASTLDRVAGIVYSAAADADALEVALDGDHHDRLRRRRSRRSVDVSEPEFRWKHETDRHGTVRLRLRRREFDHVEPFVAHALMSEEQLQADLLARAGRPLDENDEGPPPEWYYGSGNEERLEALVVEVAQAKRWTFFADPVRKVILTESGNRIRDGWMPFEAYCMKYAIDPSAVRDGEVVISARIGDVIIRRR